MKNINVFQFISDSVEDLVKYQNTIEDAETYESAKQHANRMLGHLNCLNTFVCGMICMENNDITGMLGDMIDSWTIKCYQALINNAHRTKQDSETMMKLYEKRDSVRG